MKTVVVDKLKEIEFDDINTIRKLLLLTEEERESVSIGNKAKESVYNGFLIDYKQTIF